MKAVSASIMKNFFGKYPQLIFMIPLIFFLLIGCGLLFLLLVTDQPVPFYGWLVACGFIVIPALILIDFVWGIPVPEKQVQAAEEHREILEFDGNGFSLVMPLLAATCFVRWSTVETILYTDYDSDDYVQFLIYFSMAPVVSHHPNPWWLARLFPFKIRGKSLKIKGNCKNFWLLPGMVEKYLGRVELSEFNDQRKGTLVSKSSKSDGVRSETIEHWKPKVNRENCRVVYDRYQRPLDQIFR